MIRHVRDRDALSQLAPLWKQLESARSDYRVFQSYDWCSEAWDGCLNDGRNELFVLVWEQEKCTDRVIFPFYLDANGNLRFIMDEHSDYCDCVYAPGHNHHLAFKEALEYILADARINFIALDKLDGASEALNYFSTLGRKPRIEIANAYSWIDVPAVEDFAASQAQLRSKDKANVRAIKRKADKYQLKVVSCKNGDGYPESDLDYIAREMVRSSRRDGAFMSDAIRSFCKSIYEKGLAEVVELVDDAGRPVALNFILLMGNRRLSWIFLYTNPHASTELYVKYFYGQTSGESFVFDFGTGGYDYKLGTFRPCMRTIYSLRIAVSKRAKINARIKGIKTGVKDLAALCLGKI